jgi:hypothetical protein
MNPLPDRVVIVAILLTIALCFGLAFWTVRLAPKAPPLQWRQAPEMRPGGPVI